ncbi:MAG: hypothetical protein AABW80_00555 [Nanoarchaeota archaeon]
MPFKNPEKRKEYRKEIYEKNKRKVLFSVRKRKRELGKWFLDYKKNLKCELCNENHPATIDFHHKEISSKKEGGVSYLVYNGYSINRIKEEIAKCQVLCVNCHRKTHYKNSKL